MSMQHRTYKASAGESLTQEPTAPEGKGRRLPPTMLGSPGPERALVIGIAGASCSGKSTVARKVAALTGAHLFCLDDYWISGCEKPEINGLPSYERPEQYDAKALLVDIREVLDGDPGRPVLAEGFLLFLYPGIRDLCQVKAFLHVPGEILHHRRAGRGMTGNAAGQRKSDDAWLAHGLEEWGRFGAAQARLPGVTVMDGTLPAEELARQVVGLARR